MKDTDERNSYGEMQKLLIRVLDKIKEDHNRDYFCCLMDSPEEFFKQYPELHGFPSYSIYAGEGGESLERSVSRDWRERHFYWLTRLAEKRREEK